MNYLSIQRYTTSKIKEMDDINKITTLGFRGEALSSISSVSKISLESITKDGIGLKIKNQSESIIKPSCISEGTSVVVKNIFFNTPARYKFMKHSRIEFIYSENVFKKIALSTFNIKFSLFNDKKKIKEVFPCKDFTDK